MLAPALGPMLEGCMEGQQRGLGWGIACASADWENAQQMEGEKGSGPFKDCPISKGVLKFGATFA